MSLTNNLGDVRPDEPRNSLEDGRARPRHRSGLKGRQQKLVFTLREGVSGTMASFFTAKDVRLHLRPACWAADQGSGAIALAWWTNVEKVTADSDTQAPFISGAAALAGGAARLGYTRSIPARAARQDAAKAGRHRPVQVARVQMNEGIKR